MTKRLTTKQRRERDFWLGCAERAYARILDPGAPSEFLCNSVRFHGRPEYKDCLELFLKDCQGAGWSRDANDEKIFVGTPIYGPAHGRVLAACFLAAMAELGE